MIPIEIINVLRKHNKKLNELGVAVGKLYTDHGLPIDMSLTRLKLEKEDALAVLNGSLEWLIQHKRNSGATEAALVRTRKSNRTIMERFIKTGESGVY